MKKRTTTSVIAAAAAVTGLAAGSPAAGSEHGYRSTAAVQTFADPDTAIGESTLLRTDDGVVATFAASGVEPNHAVTLWWVVFNEPQNCSAPGCGEDDIFVDGDPTAGLDADAIAAADIVAGYAAGTVVSGDGSVNFAARLAQGTPGVDVILGEGDLLKHADSAEIHLVARSHGPAIAELAEVQTTSFAGGCETDLLPPDVPANEGECGDLAFAVHQVS